MADELSRKEQYWQHNFKFSLAKESLRFGDIPPIAILKSAAGICFDPDLSDTNSSSRESRSSRR